MSTTTLLLIANAHQSSKHGREDELSSLELGLIVGLTIGVPVLIVISCYVVKCCVNAARKRKDAKAEAQPSLDDELSKYFPDAVLREKLKRGIFHDDVVQAFGDLNKESRDYIVAWMKQKHGPSKANELPLIALNP